MGDDLTNAAEWVAAIGTARRRAGLDAGPLLDGFIILRVNLHETEDILRTIFGHTPTTLSLSENDEGVVVEHADWEFIDELRVALRAEGCQVR
ncbi:hypothetical protein HII36_21960 [Nonomuraea sp. NN258]|uniref:hypothetical protein n=1 Tax=Nonomuraea antri TaxID=2730852 RepID=UPI0015696626|nr:hypothetical protein [Nonomuraea antri]NRQ34493.1 hypothetical protein [Nonomuraea antri]